jgi:hypothetical protein
MINPITLNNGTQTVELPGDSHWPDQIWTPVEAGHDDYSLDGSLHIDPFVKLAGRPITLQGGYRFAWVKFATVLILQAWAADPQSQMTLTMPDSATFTVRFRYPEPVKASPIFMFNPPRPDDDYYLTLSLITV